MTKLDEMWVEFEKHQSIADKRGHGESWAEMCSLRTEKACKAAARAAYVAAVLAVAVAEDAVCGWFAAAASNAARAVVAVDAAYAASNAAYAAAAKYAASNAAAAAAAYAASNEAAAYAEIRAQEAIDFINKAIELAEKQND